MLKFSARIAAVVFLAVGGCLISVDSAQAQRPTPEQMRERSEQGRSRGGSYRPSAEEIQRMRERAQGQQRPDAAQQQNRSAPNAAQQANENVSRGGAPGRPSAEEIARLRGLSSGNQGASDAAPAAATRSAAPAAASGDLEKRVMELEERLERMETDLQLIKTMLVAQQNQR